MLTCDLPTLNLPLLQEKSGGKMLFQKKGKNSTCPLEYSFAPFQIQKIWITFEKRITIWSFHAKY